MPVLVNSNTGLAETLAQDQADQALQAGTHEIPLNDPQGNPITANLDQAQQLLSGNQGYSQPSTDQLGNLLDYAKFSSLPEEAKTAAEGAASAATFGLSTGAETAAGINPADIRSRREVNPGLYGLGQVGGLLGSLALPEVASAAGLARGLGEAGAAGLGLGAEGAGVLSQVGSAAAKNMIETALISTGDQVSKAFTQDPSQSVETAMTDIGLSGLLGAGIGGAFGTVSPLWKAAQETPVGKFLNVIKNKANGLEKGVLPDASIGAAADAAGIQIPNEVKAALSDNPDARQMFQTLQESTTKSGKEAQESFDLFKKQVNQGLLNSLGKTAEDVDALPSDFDAGTSLKENLVKELQDKTGPLSDEFERIRDKFAGASLSEAEKADIANQITDMAQKGGYGLLEGTPQGSLINKITASLPKIDTLEDLRKLQSQIGEQTQNPEMWGLGKGLKSIFRNAEENSVETKLGAEAPDLLVQHQAARAGYRNAMDTIDSLNDRLHVGRYAGPGSFIKAVQEMNPEDLLRRMTPKNDASFLDLMNQEFPFAKQTMQENYLNQALKAGAMRTAPGEAVNPKSLFNALDKWSPELKQFALPAGADQKLSGVRSLLQAIPSRMNPSGTAKTLDALWQKMPGGVGGMIGMLAGHNPLAGYVLGQIGRYVGREVPDAMKLATLKFLGSDLPINSSAFKALAEMATSAYKGQQLMTNAAKAIFKAGAVVLPQSAEPKRSTIQKLKAKVNYYNAHTADLLDMGGHTGYYLADHGVALGAVSGRAIAYLNQIKPSTDKMGILGGEQVPSQMAEAQYDRALKIAEQPLMVLKHLKDGNLLPTDIATMKTIYPSLFNQVKQQLTEEMINTTSKGNKIPYSTRVNLSMFLGQPLDNTMTPMAMQTIQAQSKGMNQVQQPMQKGSKSKGSMSELGKTNTLYETPVQASEAKHAMKA